MKKTLSALALGLVATNALAATTPTMEEMWALIQKQQAEIEQLRAQVAQAGTQLQQANTRIEATADLVEQRVVTPAPEVVAGAGQGTHLGGYAEMHYNNWENDRDAGSDKDELDFHRFVFFLGHDFSPRTRFFSEVEIEHSVAGEGQEGEVELEQAYIEHDVYGTQRLKAGLFLVPVGLLNETHEPDTFYGVERNNVENRIIPTTWWEGGLAMGGEIAPGFSYDASFTSGLALDPDAGQWAIRDGRQKVSEADASDPAYTARLKYTGIAGLELAATAQYQQDLYQGEFAEDVDAILYETHLAYQQGPFGLRALYAGWDIDEAIETFKAGAQEQAGWYVEPSWRFNPKLGVFTRYSEWDNQAGGGGDTEYSQWDVGLNYWLEETVVFKMDYQFQDAPAGKDQFDGLNLGVGWSF